MRWFRLHRSRRPTPLTPPKDAARHAVNALVAQWVADHDQAAGAQGSLRPGQRDEEGGGVRQRVGSGAVGVQPKDLERFSDPDQRRLLETCASLIALSLERDQSMLAAEDARRSAARSAGRADSHCRAEGLVEAERLREIQSKHAQTPCTMGGNGPSEDGRPP